MFSMFLLLFDQHVSPTASLLYSVCVCNCWLISYCMNMLVKEQNERGLSGQCQRSPLPTQSRLNSSCSPKSFPGQSPAKSVAASGHGSELGTPILKHEPQRLSHEQV